MRRRTQKRLTRKKHTDLQCWPNISKCFPCFCFKRMAREWLVLIKQTWIFFKFWTHVQFAFTFIRTRGPRGPTIAHLRSLDVVNIQQFKAKRKKYVWFRWSDPTYFFSPDSKLFFIWIRKKCGPIFYPIFKRISKNAFKAFMYTF